MTTIRFKHAVQARPRTRSTKVKGNQVQKKHNTQQVQVGLLNNFLAKVLLCSRSRPLLFSISPCNHSFFCLVFVKCCEVPLDFSLDSLSLLERCGCCGGESDFGAALAWPKSNPESSLPERVVWVFLSFSQHHRPHHCGRVPASSPANHGNCSAWMWPSWMKLVSLILKSVEILQKWENGGCQCLLIFADARQLSPPLIDSFENHSISQQAWSHI